MLRPPSHMYQTTLSFVSSALAQVSSKRPSTQWQVIYLFNNSQKLPSKAPCSAQLCYLTNYHGSPDLIEQKPKVHQNESNSRSTTATTSSTSACTSTLATKRIQGVIIRVNELENKCGWACWLESRVPLASQCLGVGG